MRLSKISESLHVVYKVESSAYNTKYRLCDALQMSLKYIITNKGPRVEHCGTQ